MKEEKTIFSNWLVILLMSGNFAILVYSIFKLVEWYQK